MSTKTIRFLPTRTPGVFGSLVSARVNLFNAQRPIHHVPLRPKTARRRQYPLGFLIPGARFTHFHGVRTVSHRIDASIRRRRLVAVGLAPGTQSTVSAGITRSTLNHPLFPTVGSRQAVNIDFTGGPSGGMGDSSNIRRKEPGGSQSGSPVEMANRAQEPSSRLA